MVCKTVLLEFEWVMRGYYQFTSSDISHVFQHLLSLEHLMIEEIVWLRNKQLIMLNLVLILRMLCTMPATKIVIPLLLLTMKNLQGVLNEMA